MANDPPILVADEPTGNLDSKTAASIFCLFGDLIDSGKTILVVTHDRDLANRVTRTIVLSDGEIVEEVSNGSVGRQRDAVQHAVTDGQSSERARRGAYA